MQNMLNYGYEKSLKPFDYKGLRLCVIRLGFEPKTHSLEGCCSIQLSYRTIQNGLQR